ncbi:MAG: PAS domain-containing protein [Actinomycetia bacterium]|nr:PAS domain-containing protein [Actinomycetes bacterium]
MGYLILAAQLLTGANSSLNILNDLKGILPDSVNPLPVTWGIEQLYTLLEFCGLLLGIVSILIIGKALRQPRMRFLFAAAFSSCLISTCALLIQTATTISQMTLMLRISLVLGQLAAILIYLFVHDYTMRRITLVKSVVLAAWAAMSAALMVVYPLDSIFNAQLVAGQAYFLPGAMFLIFSFVSFVLVLLACINYVSYIAHAKWHAQLIIPVFLLIMALPVVAALLYLGNVLPGSYNPMPLAGTLAIFVICIYVTRWQLPEWEVLGRYEVVQNMQDAYLIVDRNCFLVDLNRQAQICFPSLEGIKPGRLLLGVPGFPSEILDQRVHDLVYQAPNFSESRHYLITHTQLDIFNRNVGQAIVIHDDTDSVEANELRIRQHLESNTTKLINSSPFICLVFDAQSNIIDCNTAALRFFGMSDKKMVRKELPELLVQGFVDSHLGSEPAQPFMKHLQEAQDRGRDEFYVDFRLRNKNILLHFSMRGIQLQSGFCVAAYIFPPPNHERLLQFIIDEAPWPCDVVDTSMAVVQVNYAAVSLLGFNSQQEYCKDHWNTIPTFQSEGSDSMELLFQKIEEAQKRDRSELEFEFQTVGAVSRSIRVRMQFRRLDFMDKNLLVRYFKPDTTEQPSDVPTLLSL